ncbi:MAG: hypothetical protein DMF61_01510 [Blastocatellia bacterium AA13]|nr:MAG: hypothetical protein DMF61_01510 [Blastocatellia bacterium AA13]
MLVVHPLANASGDGGPECQPGPKVAQELSRLERDARSIYKQFRDGRVSQLTLIREMARLKTTIEVLKDWACRNNSDQIPELVVIVDSDDLVQVFPRGMRHISGRLVPGDTYPATALGSRQWQYLGERKVSGMRVNIFRYVTADSASAGDKAN